MTFTATVSVTPSAGTPAYVPAHPPIPARLARLMLTREERLSELSDLLDYLADWHGHAGNHARSLALDERLGNVLDATIQEREVQALARGLASPLAQLAKAIAIRDAHEAARA